MGATVLPVHVILVFHLPVLFETDLFSKVLILKCGNLLHNTLFYFGDEIYSKLSFGSKAIRKLFVYYFVKCPVSYINK